MIRFVICIYKHDHHDHESLLAWPVPEPEIISVFCFSVVFMG